MFAMEIEFGSKKLRKQFSNASEIKMAFGTRAKFVSQRKDEIESSPTLTVLMQIPAADCHQLAGKRNGQWAVKISGNFRIIFKIADDPLPMKNPTEIDPSSVTKICIIEIVDYH
jgi:plasmid maintenance system killer protein